MRFIEWITTPWSFTRGEIIYILSAIMIGMTFSYNWFMFPFFVGSAIYGKYMIEEEIKLSKKQAVKEYNRSKRPK